METLINQEHLETLCLSKEAQQALAEQVINQLKAVETNVDAVDGLTKPKLSLLRRYATARALYNVMTTVVERIGLDIIAELERTGQGADGKNFYEDEMWFNRQLTLIFSKEKYQENDTSRGLDGDWVPNAPSYANLCKQEAQFKKLYEQAKNARRNRESEIVLVHEKMQPDEVKDVLRFLGTDGDKINDRLIS